MKKNPIFTGIAGGLIETGGISVENLLGKSGLNTGNFLFVSALRKILGQKERIYNTFEKELKTAKEIDYIAISAANWINKDIDLEKLALYIESTNLPCLVVGLGGQISFGESPPKLKEGTIRFLKVVSERSKYISVRGENTKNLLEYYGIKNTWVTGCPSLLGNGSNIIPVSETPIIKDFSNIVFQGTRHGYSEMIFSDSQINRINLEIYRFAISNNNPLLLQSEFPDMYYTMARNNNATINEKNEAFLTKVYNKKNTVINDYLLKHGLLFWDVDVWQKELGKYEMLIGTRIHGVISAILSGIPAALLVHDERTKELADAMSLPYQDARNINTFNKKTVYNIIEKVNFEKFNISLTQYTENFKKFFEVNDVYNIL